MYLIIHRTRKSDGVMHKPPWRTREVHTEDGVTKGRWTLQPVGR